MRAERVREARETSKLADAAVRSIGWQEGGGGGVEWQRRQGWHGWVGEKGKGKR